MKEEIENKITFFCLSNFESGKCIYVPFEWNETVHPFVIVQNLYKFLKDNCMDFIFFSDLLLLLDDGDPNKFYKLLESKETGDLKYEPFGYDGNSTHMFFTSSYVCIKPKTLYITSNDKFIPIPYYMIDDKFYFNSSELFEFDAATSVYFSMTANIEKIFNDYKFISSGIQAFIKSNPKGSFLNVDYDITPKTCNTLEEFLKLDMLKDYS